MLGYVKTNTPELRVRDHLYYRGLYCGLCHRMGKCTGNCSRMTLSYDFVFLATVRLALSKEAVEMKKQRCFLHPLRPRMTAQKCKTLDFCADASALLVYHKLRDDISDEKGLKKLRAYLVRPFLYSAYCRAKKRLPDLDALMAKHLATLAVMERSSDAHFGADPYAEVFGELLASVVSHGFEGTEARIAQSLGRTVGKWIYLVDAADDFEDDKKKGRFNPYLNLFGSSPTPEDWKTVELSLKVHLCDAERAFSLLDGYTAPEQKEIVANILFSGLPKTGSEMTLQKNANQCKCGKKSKRETDKEVMIP